MTNMFYKIKCFFGFHQMYNTKKIKETYRFSKWKRKCSCCNRVDTKVSKWGASEGRREYIEATWYVGDYNWFLLLGELVRRFK